MRRSNFHQGGPGTPTRGGRFVETLEGRNLLSVGLPGLLDWPVAPFVSPVLRSSIYVNQKGDAILRHPQIGVRSGINGYNLSFDDPGAVRLSTGGRVATDLAFYVGPGRPGWVNASNDGVATLNVLAGADKGMLNVGVRAHEAGAKGRYVLRINGPAFNFIEPIPISSALNAGSAGSDISGYNDSDFYRFTVPRTGNWVVKAIPDTVQGGLTPRLDATLNVFNSRGDPVGGDFTHAINAGGSGATEHWTGVGLLPGAEYFVRVDGAGDSTGGYGVSVELAELTDVAVVASDPQAAAGGKNAGQFVISRTDNGPLPLTVRYGVSGTAASGQQYESLGGLATIPAGQLFVTINVKPLAGVVFARDETVIVKLSPSPLYNIGPSGTAVVTIVKAKAR